MHTAALPLDTHTRPEGVRPREAPGAVGMREPSWGPGPGQSLGKERRANARTGQNGHTDVSTEGVSRGSRCWLPLSVRHPEGSIQARCPVDSGFLGLMLGKDRLEEGAVSSQRWWVERERI